MLLVCGDVEKSTEQKIKQYIDEYGKWLSNLCYVLCKNKCDAEDVYQETWVKIISNFYRFDKKRDFRPWATKICVNCFKDLCRKRKRSADFSSDEEKQRFLASIPSITEEDKQDYSKLYEALERLNTNERIAISLFYFHDISGETAAKIMGKSYGSFRLLISRTLKKLRKELEK